METKMNIMTSRNKKGQAAITLRNNTPVEAVIVYLKMLKEMKIAKLKIEII